MEAWSLKESTQGKRAWSNAKDSDYKDLWMRQAKAVRSSAAELSKTIENSGLPRDVQQSFNRRVWALSTAHDMVKSTKVNGRSIADLANSGKISWKDVDAALKDAFTAAKSLDSSSGSWGSSVKGLIEKHLGMLAG